MENKIKENIESSFELEKEYPFVKIYVSHEHRLICPKWSGLLDLHQIKTGCNSFTEIIAKYGYDKILSDTTEVKGTWTGAMEWLMTEWWPSAVAAGLKKIAFIYSSDVFAKFSVDSFVKKGNQKEDVVSQNAFRNFNDAFEWITQG